VFTALQPILLYCEQTDPTLRTYGERRVDSTLRRVVRPYVRPYGTSREAVDARPPSQSQAEAKIIAITLQLPNIRAAIHHIWKSVYTKYPTEEYGQATVWTLAKKTIATFILDYQQQCGKGKHPAQEIKNQIKLAHNDANTHPPSQDRGGYGEN
jgi:hypothetical protein